MCLCRGGSYRCREDGEGREAEGRAQGLRAAERWGKLRPEVTGVPPGPQPVTVGDLSLDGHGFCDRKRDYDRFRGLSPSLIGKLRFREMGGLNGSRGLRCPLDAYLVSDLSCPRLWLEIQLRERVDSLPGTHSMSCSGRKDFFFLLV